MLILNEREVSALLMMPHAIALMEEGFRALARGGVQLPLRTMTTTARGVLGSMPAAMQAQPGSALAGTLGCKLVTAFANNAELGKPSHQALVLLFDPDSGEAIALMDGRYITEVRTAATSALATKLLARPDAKLLTVIGTGVQARAHVEAIRHVMEVRELRIWGRTPDHAAALAEYARSIGLNATVSPSVADATKSADVICTTTGTLEPLLFSRDVSDGAHINAVGMAWPNGRELGSDLMGRVRIIVDSTAGALGEAGDVRLAIADGALSKTPDLVPLSDVVDGRAAGRSSNTDVTLFESVGIAIEDVVCAAFVYKRARETGTGTEVEV